MRQVHDICLANGATFWKQWCNTAIQHFCHQLYDLWAESSAADQQIVQSDDHCTTGFFYAGTFSNANRM